MRVKNRKCIRRLSFKSLWASRKRNIIAICAIALTTLMFTSLFTIMLSVNSSYETYNFRQAGGYSDGSFKDLSREQADKIAAHKGIKASGERIVCGFSSSDVFGKVAAEVSYMDKNCTKWSYATPTTGKEPQKENEIAMDTTALRLLGVEPKLGTNVTITYQAEFNVIKSMHYRGRFGANKALTMTLIPTMNCNFRCPYCYEKDKKYPVKKMTTEVMDYSSCKKGRVKL